MANQLAIDDLLDARAEVRRLRKQVTDQRLALRASKDKLTAALDRLEDNLTQLEQQQGRLPFGDDAAEPKPAPAARNGRRHHQPAAAAQAGQSNWKSDR
jgi:septal ring factor EnvC (AmiA/AmiB activator)